MLVLTDSLITDLHTTTRLRGSYVYLATPYSRYKDGLQAAVRDAAIAAYRLHEEGIPYFCPITHSHTIAVENGHDPRDHKFWMDGDAIHMRQAACLLVCKMPGWDESRGVEIETLKFRDDGKRVFYAEWKPIGLLPDPEHDAQCRRRFDRTFADSLSEALKRNE